MNNILRFTLLCLTPVLLNGCAPLGNESFSSEPGKGFGWKSMQENHQLIHQQSTSLPLTVTPQPYLVQSGPLTTVQRAPEQSIRVWFAPYQDEGGNLHEESALHTVIQTGQWFVPSFSLDEQPFPEKENL
jgi:hypothetical protein